MSRVLLHGSRRSSSARLRQAVLRVQLGVAASAVPAILMTSWAEPARADVTSSGTAGTDSDGGPGGTGGGAVAIDGDTTSDFSQAWSYASASGGKGGWSYWGK